MSETKSHQFRPPLYHEETTPAPRQHVGTAADAARKDKKGWDAYRKWLSTVSHKTQGERTPVDHSIYSWKGYHNWADRVRQSWKSDDE
jgi:hypothetical protein